jgi:dihydroneopterin aldolase/2-amino-4-hydroxy-6-hydroxymethyldihydropteridine diphosphokinase/dihydropteroate synthase
MSDQDVVFVYGIQLDAIVGKDSWGRLKPQPLLVDVEVLMNIERAAANDRIDDSLDYRLLYNDCVRSKASETFPSPVDFLHKIKEDISRIPAVIDVKASVTLPRALRQSEKGVTFTSPLGLDRSSRESSIRINLHEIRLNCIIGLHAHEQLAKQPVIIDIELEGSFPQDSGTSIQRMYAEAIQKAEDSSWKTLEKFVCCWAYDFWKPYSAGTITISARKSTVFPNADGPGVRITRNAAFFSKQTPELGTTS